MQINNGQIILRGAILKGASILIEDGKIGRIGKFSSPRSANSIDAGGLFVSPGFVDSHIHGDPARVLAHEIRYGTTAIVPAISCGSDKSVADSVRSIRRFMGKDALGASVLGLRLEGPFISKERAGAQDKRFIKPPSSRKLRGIIKSCGGLLRIMTLAPELEGSSKLIRILRENDVIASMGHTDAGYKDAVGGITAGITHATHLFNGMRREAGGKKSAAIACLADRRVKVEIIFDLIHVQESLLGLALTMKEKDGVILITDSVRAEFRTPNSGVYRLKDGTIAGSSLTMIGAVKNAVSILGVRLNDAVAFASINPARLLGVDASKGSIEKGKDADIIIFDKDFDVKMTMVRGKIIYRKRGF